VLVVDCGIAPSDLLDLLAAGTAVIFAPGTRYGNCCELYARVRDMLGRRDAIDSYDAQQAYYARVADTFRGLSMPVREGRLDLTGLPEPVRQVPSSWLPSDRIAIREHFGLVSAGSWHVKGVQYPQLPFRLYPERGTYFATPFSSWAGAHFDLFQRWLDGGGLAGVGRALDVGTGIGVLAFMMLEASRSLHVTATDINPHAIASIVANAKRQG